MKTKFTKKSKLFIAIFVLAVVVGIGFSGIKSVQAEECVCKSYDEFGDLTPVKSTLVNLTSEDECKEHCKNSEGYYFGKKDTNTYNTTLNTQKNDVCKGVGLTSGVKSWMNCVLLYVLNFVSLLLPIAGTIFTWVIEPNNMNAVINNGAIYASWALVRDTLNIAFILVLLFSAFCTVFQVEKFNYKKILLTLVIMALLVNFSFPISRFIIDAANSMMYFFLNGLDFGKQAPGNFFAGFANDANIGNIFGATVSSDTSFLIAAIIFVFIFAITLLVIAVLLVIRIVALAFLIIFSPIAFTGTIVPSLASMANKWWDNLFKYAFFGPIMVFMLYVASKMMNYIQVDGAIFNKIAGAQSDASVSSFVSAVALYSVPIVILWIGIGIAQSMSIYGAEDVVGRAKRAINWTRDRASGYNWFERRRQAFLSERKKRSDEAFRENWGRSIGHGINRVEDTIHGALPIPGSTRARKRIEDMHNADVREYMKEISDITNEGELANRWERTGNRDEREAIVRRLASIGGSDTLLNRAGYTSNRVGFANFVRDNFGENERSLRLGEALADLETTKGNVQYKGAVTYDTATGGYQLNRGAANAATIGAQFAAAGGEHPQNVARKLKSGFVVTTGPTGTAPAFNDDFERFLQNMGTDFNNQFTNGVNNNQLREIPASVINQLQTMRNATPPINPPAGSRTEYLITQLVAAGRLT